MESRLENGLPARTVNCARKGALSPRRAFTLVELLVLVCVVAFGFALLASGLARTQPASKAVQCLNNHRQLVNAWRVYSGDYNDRVANNFGVDETFSSVSSGRLENWANNVMTWGASLSTTDRGNTNIAWVTNGVMGKYPEAPVSAYHCPADTYLSPVQVRAGYPGRLRSVSMNSVLGRFSTGTDPTAQGLNWALTLYSQYLKNSQISKPAKTWVFIEEHPDSINDGYYVNLTTAANWQDIPGSLHNGGCTFCFADGHAELRKWLSATSQYPVGFNYPFTRTFDPQGRLDFAWYLERTGYILAKTGDPQFGY